MSAFPAIVLFCALVAALVEPAGIAPAFAAATAGALAIQLATARVLRPGPVPA